MPDILFPAIPAIVGDVEIKYIGQILRASVEDGTHSAVYVVGRRDGLPEAEAYSTHLLVLPRDAEPFLIWGNYDLSEIDAYNNLVKR